MVEIYRRWLDWTPLKEVSVRSAKYERQNAGAHVLDVHS